MLKLPIKALLACIFMLSSLNAYESLQEIYNLAESNGEYDKFIELTPETEYLGDLIVDYGTRTRIIGNGAIIHGIPDTRSIWVWGSHMDISNCIIEGGQIGIHFDTSSTGSIYNNTIVNCDSIGIAAYFFEFNPGVEIYDNIVVGGKYGFICLEDWQPNYLGENTIYASLIYRYSEYCYD